MGCASSKPSKDKKNSSKQQKLNKKSKSTDNGIQHSATDEANLSNNNKPDTQQNIRIEKHLIEQIKRNEVAVVEYIVPIVRTEQAQEGNEELISDVVSKAVNTLVNTPLPNTTLSYKSLNASLKAWPFICKNQANKQHICDTTTETIRECMSTINHESDENAKFDLVNFLSQNSAALTPPQTPVKATNMSPEEIWNENAVLMNRTKANQLARLLFLSNKARPVIHSSTRVRDAYYVNRELPDKTQVCISQNEIDDLLNNSTYKNNPHISPVTQRKLDFSGKDVVMARSETSPEVGGNEEVTVLLKVENETLASGAVELDTTVEDITWLNLTTAEDFEKKEVVNLTDQVVTVEDASCDTNVIDQSDSREDEAAVETSCDTNVVDQSVGPLEQDTEFLNAIVKEINNINNVYVAAEAGGESDEKVVGDFITVTPPPSPTPVEKTIGDFDEYAQSAVDTEKIEADGNLDPVLKQDLIDDRFYNNDYKDGPPVNATDAENEAATKIQASFKGEAVRQGQGEVQTSESDLSLNRRASKIRDAIKSHENSPTDPDHNARFKQLKKKGHKKRTAKNN